MGVVWGVVIEEDVFGFVLVEFYMQTVVQTIRLFTDIRVQTNDSQL